MRLQLGQAAQPPFPLSIHAAPSQVEQSGWNEAVVELYEYASGSSPFIWRRDALRSGSQVPLHLWHSQPSS